MRIILWCSTLNSHRSTVLVLNVLKVSILYRYNIALFMYKLNNSVLPDIFPMFVHNYEINNYETRQLKQFHIPMCHTNLTKMFIKYQGPVIWNDISSNVEVNCFIGTFKNVQKLILLVIISKCPITINVVISYCVWNHQIDYLCRLHGSYFCCCCDMLYLLSKDSLYSIW